ncbi:hypothetical protein ACQJBY_050619 [Aegilops geniculata]
MIGNALSKHKVNRFRCINVGKRLSYTAQGRDGAEATRGSVGAELSATMMSYCWQRTNKAYEGMAKWFFNWPSHHLSPLLREIFWSGNSHFYPLIGRPLLNQTEH